MGGFVVILEQNAVRGLRLADHGHREAGCQCRLVGTGRSDGLFTSSTSETWVSLDRRTYCPLHAHSTRKAYP